MANIRLSVVVRRDLNLVPGALAAQVSHISDSWMRAKILAGKHFTKIEKDWMIDPYISILGVGNREELDIIIKNASLAALPFSEFTDTIYSETLKTKIYGVKVGVAIGPADFDKISTVTSILSPF